MSVSATWNEWTPNGTSQRGITRKNINHTEWRNLHSEGEENMRYGKGPGRVLQQNLVKEIRRRGRGRQVATKGVGETQQNYLLSNYETEYHCRPVEAGHCTVSWENNKSRLQSSGPDHESVLKENSFQW